MEEELAAPGTHAGPPWTLVAGLSHGDEIDAIHGTPKRCCPAWTSGHAESGFEDVATDPAGIDALATDSAATSVFNVWLVKACQKRCMADGDGRHGRRRSRRCEPCCVLGRALVHLLTADPMTICMPGR